MQSSFELGVTQDKVALELEATANGFRQLEHDKRSIIEGAESEGRRYSWAIEKMVVESRRLKKELSELREFGGSELKDMRTLAVRMSSMEENIEMLDRDISTEEARNEELSTEASSLQQKIDALRSEILAAGGVPSDRAAEDVLRRRISVLESKLTRGMSNFGRLAISNRESRETCDTMRIECESLKELIAKVEAEVVGRSAKMVGVIEKANQCFDMRDKVRAKLTFLRQAFDREASEFDAEMRELDSLIENDKSFSSLLRARKIGKVESMSSSESRSSSDDSGRSLKPTSHSDPKDPCICDPKDPSMSLTPVDENSRFPSSAGPTVVESAESLCKCVGWSSLAEGQSEFLNTCHDNFGMYMSLREMDRLSSQLERHSASGGELQKKIGSDFTAEQERVRNVFADLGRVLSENKLLEGKASRCQETLKELCAQTGSMLVSRNARPPGWLEGAEVNTTNIGEALAAIEMMATRLLIKFAQSGGVLDYGPPKELQRLSVVATAKERMSVKQELTREAAASTKLARHGITRLSSKDKLSSTQDKLSSAKDKLSSAKDKLCSTQDKLSSTRDKPSSAKTLSDSVSSVSQLVRDLKACGPNVEAAALAAVNPVQKQAEVDKRRFASMLKTGFGLPRVASVEPRT